MRTFAQQQGSVRQTTSVKSAGSTRASPGQRSSEMSPVLHVQRTMGNQAAQRFLQADAELKKAKRRARILRRWLTRIAGKEAGDVAVNQRNIRRARWVRLLQDAGEPGFTRLSDRERAQIDRLTSVRFVDPGPIEINDEEQAARPADSADDPVAAAPERAEPCATFAFTDCSPARDLEDLTIAPYTGWRGRSSGTSTIPTRVSMIRTPATAYRMRFRNSTGRRCGAQWSKSDGNRR